MLEGIAVVRLCARSVASLDLCWHSARGADLSGIARAHIRRCDSSLLFRFDAHVNWHLDLPRNTGKPTRQTALPRRQLGKPMRHHECRRVFPISTYLSRILRSLSLVVVYSVSSDF